MNKVQYYIFIFLFIFYIFNLKPSAYADQKESCDPVQVNIINLENQPVLIGQAGGNLPIPGGSSGYYKIIPKTFYTKQCQAITLTTLANSDPQLALIKDKTLISIRVEPNGEISSNLPYNFSVNQLIPYYGLRPFLS